MSEIDTEPKMAESFGIQEFFVTDVGLVENAGGGNVRVIRCIKRRGILFPVFSLVTPMLSMIAQAPIVRDAAQELFGREMAARVSQQRH